MVLPEWSNTLLNKINSIRNDPKVSKILRIISIIYPIVLIYFSKNEILKMEWGSFFGIFLICFLIYYVSMALQNVAWSLLVDRNLTNFWFNSKVYFQTVLMKRLPGGIWHWLGRANLYDSQVNNERNSIRRANLTEWLLLIFSGLSGYAFTVNLWLGVISLILTIGTGFLLVNRENHSWVRSLLLSIILTVTYAICWLVGALILHWLLLSLNPSGDVTFQSSIGIWCLSSAIGMFFFFFPSGALIRDFSLSALLSKQYEPAKFLLIILQVRIIFLVADLLWSFFSLQFIKLIKEKPTSKAN